MIKYPFEVSLIMNWRLHLIRTNKGKPGLYRRGDIIKMEHALSRIQNRLILSEAEKNTLVRILVRSKLNLKYDYLLPTDRKDKSFTKSIRIAYEIKGMFLLIHQFNTKAKVSRSANFIKKLQGYHVDKFGFEWCSVTIENQNKLRSTRWTVTSPTLKNVFKRKLANTKLDMSRLDPRSYPYQIEGIRMLVAGCRLLGDDMGLGKGNQVSQFIRYKKISPILIICPASLKIMWKDELLKWGVTNNEEEIELLYSRTPYPLSANSKYMIINYDILYDWSEALAKIDWNLIVVDECQALSNPDAKRTIGYTNIIDSKNIVTQLDNKQTDVIMVSGTPFRTRPIQFYVALHSIKPELFSSYHEYGLMFCDAKREYGSWSYKGASNLDILNDILNDGIMIRRLKKDVLKDLPIKRRLVIPMELSENERTKEIREKIDSAKTELGSWEYEKQYASYLKIESCIKWIDLYLESSDKKLCVFAVHKEIITMLMKEFKKKYNAVKLDGSTSAKNKDIAKKTFQNDPKCRLFIGNTKSAGEGLTLTAASDTCTIEFGQTVSEHMQVEDRVCRIGQKADSIFAYYLIAKDTIDETVMRILNANGKIQKNALNGDKGDNLFKLARQEKVSK